MNDLAFEQREPLRGVGVRDPDADELESGWMRLGGGAYMRITYGEPDGGSAECGTRSAEW